LDAGLVVENLHEPLFKGLVARADIEPSSQQLLMGCTGSGKTTLLLQAEKWLDQSGQVLPLYIDISAETDLTKLCSGALLASFGMHLLQEFSSRSLGAQMPDSAREALRNAEREIRGFAYGTTKKVWVKDSPGFGAYVSVLDAASALNTIRSALGERGRYEDLAVPGKLSPPRGNLFRPR
jgi:hypothetical protein